MAAPGFDRDVPDGVETPADFPTKVSDIVREVWEQAGRVQQPEEYLPLILPRLAGAVGADFCALAVAEEGRWEAIGQTGLPRSLPV